MTKSLVVFDVYQTLIHIQSNENDLETYKFLSAWLAYQGLYIEPQELLNLYQEKTNAEIRTNTEPYPDVDIGLVFKNILTSLDKAGSDRIRVRIDELSLLFRMLTTTSIGIYPETKPLLEALSGHGIRLAIASNTQRLFTLPELRKFDLEKYFERIVFSSDVKAAKPNPKIFMALLNSVKIQPQNVIFVGDNLFDDIWGAQRMGMKTIWLNRNPVTKFPDEFERPTPDQEITDNFFQNLYTSIISMI